MRTKKAKICAMAVLLAALLPLSAMAKTWDNVDTSDKMTEAFADTDADVVINLTGDITMLQDLETKVGQTYTINGKDYTISNVVFYGSGTVNADTNFSGIDDNALTVNDNVTAVVNGNVTGNGDGVTVNGVGNVTVNGDVTVDGTGVQANGSGQAAINGDITADNYGVAAGNDTSVTVTGDIKSGYQDDGVLAYDNANVTVTGDITAGGTGVEASGNTIVDVKGNVTGGSGDPDDVDYDNGSDYSDGSTGVIASGNTNVTIDGNVTGGQAYGTYGYAGDGVEANDTATVTVTGNTVGGNVTATPETVGEQSLGGNGVWMEDTANVTVLGNAVGGDTNGNNGKAGSGVCIYLTETGDGPVDVALNGEAPEDPSVPGKLYVKGTLTGGKALTDDAISGNGLFYDVEVPEGADVNLDDILLVNKLDSYADVQAVLDDIQNERYAILSQMMASLSYTPEQAQAQLDSIDNDIYKAIGAAIGKDIYDPTSADDNTAIAALSTDATTALIQAVAEAYNKRTIDLTKTVFETAVGTADLGLPQVTVWSIEGSGDAEAVDSSVGQLFAQIFNDYHNYIVRVATTTNGKISTDKETAKPGETVTITATPDTGYMIDSVKLNGVALTAVDGVYSFVMPQYGGVEVSAEFKAQAAPAPVPKTSDNSNMNMFAVLAVMSLLGIGVMTLRLKKSSNASL